MTVQIGTPLSASATRVMLLGAGELGKEDIDRLIAFAHRHGGIEYAYARMREMQAEASKILESFPDSEPKRAFAAIFDYIIERKF